MLGLFPQHDVPSLSCQTVTQVSLSAQTVTVNSGFGTQPKDIEEIAYEHLVLAPGAFPRRLPIDGAQDPSEGGKENIFTLRGVADVKRIDEGESHPILSSAGAYIFPLGSRKE